MAPDLPSQRPRSLLRAIGTYGLALAVARGVSVLAVPLVTWAVAPDDLGAFAVLNSLVVLTFATVVDFGLDTAALRLASDEVGERRRCIFSTLVALRMLLAAAGTCGLVLIRDRAAEALGSGRYADLLPWLALTLLLGSPARAISNWLRVEGRHLPVALVMGLVGALEGGLFIVLVYLLRWGLDGLVAARLASQVVVLLPLLWLGRGVLRTRPSWRWVSPLFRLGVPFAALYALTGLRELDRYIVAELGSLSVAGVYDLAVRAAAPLGMLNLALMMTLEPVLHARHADATLGRDVDAFLRGYAWLGGSLSFLVAMGCPELSSWVSEPYRAVVVVVPGMLFLEVLEGVRRIAGVGGELSRRTELWIVAAAVNAAVTVVLSLWLVPRFPLLGAPAALLAGTASGTLVAHRLGERAVRLKLSVPLVGSLCLASAALASWLVGAGRVGPTPGWIRAAASLAFPVALAGALGVRWATMRSTLSTALSRLSEPR